MTTTDSVQLTRNLRDSGYSSNDLARDLRQGSRVHVRHGAYADESTTDANERHRRLIAGTVPGLRRPAAVSHSSAALLHGLPTWPQDLGRVHVTRDDEVGGRLTRHLHVHAAKLLDGDTDELDGLLTTSLSRTTADQLRSLPERYALAFGDAALRRGLTVDELEQQILRQAGRHGIGQLTRLASMIDARSESVGESISRLVMRRAQVPTPHLQYEIRDPITGRLLARTDFAWPELRTLGEFDGKVKYGRLLTGDRDVAEIVYEEKLREDLLRDLGWQVVRWIWPDLDHPDVIRDRLNRAFARARG